ncbi:DUF2779 domain-containing protein [Gracilimonas sp. Q87]|uniref:DUF2779 domain-containing protein n=1 Tax=Gracilimonas sp. Q87 TaxID=3384766 RepID=UPI0039841600
MPKYLTNTLFRHSLDCPTKLYYATNPEYSGRTQVNAFVQSLAGGGIQVRELAKLYYPEGNSTNATDPEAAFKETEKLLKQDKAVIYDATVLYRNYLAEIDIVEKDKNTLKLVNVLPKSWEPGESFIANRGYNIKKKWQQGLFDLAFQFWVAKKAYPDLDIVPCLMLIDKSRHNNINGLQKKFEVIENPGGYEVKVKPGISAKDLEYQILHTVDVNYEVTKILDGKARDSNSELEEEGFESWLESLNRHLQDNEKYPPEISSHCINCEYNLNRNKLAGERPHGFAECWKEALDLKEEDFNEPDVFDIWNEWGIQKKYLDKDVYLMKDIVPHMLPSNPQELYTQTKCTDDQRKTVQIMKTTGNHSPSEVVLSGLLDEMKNWRYPFHFISYEAVPATIPFNVKHYPDDYVPFQFSCHTMYENRKIEHSANWIAENPEELPGIEFARQLKKCLEKDKGTVFTYKPFDHSLLNKISRRIKRIKPDDEKELREWLATFISSDDREIVEQKRLVKDYYYSPYMGSSISISDVVTAVLTESKRLQATYIKPYNGVYLKDEILYQPDPKKGAALNPYKILNANRYSIPDYGEVDLYMDKNPISESDKSMMNWSLIQLDNVSTEERKSVLESLHMKNELDTLVMVMIHQHLSSLFNFNYG